MLNRFKTLFFYIVRGIETFVSYWSNYSFIPKPSVMYMELTYRCNLRCAFCERWKIGPEFAQKELTTEEVKKVLNQAYKIGVKYVGFTGGEPFLRKDLFEIGRFAKNLGLTVTVASNGTLINENNIKEIVTAFDSITISVDGILKETHDYLRGVKGGYTLAMDVIDLLKKWRMPVSANMVIVRQNFAEIDEYIQFFSKKRIPIQLTPFHEYEISYLKVDEDLKQINMDEFREEWLNLSRKYPFLNRKYYKYIPTFLSTSNRLLHSYICFAGAVMFFVNPYGEVFPCEFNRNSMGNIRQEPLALIWEKSKEIRRNIASAQRHCICWTHCVVPLNHRLTRFIALRKGITK